MEVEIGIRDRGMIGMMGEGGNLDHLVGRRRGERTRGGMPGRGRRRRRGRRRGRGERRRLLLKKR